MKYQYSYEEIVYPKNERVVFRLYQLNLDENMNRIYRGFWDQSVIRFIEKDLT